MEFIRKYSVYLIQRIGIIISKQIIDDLHQKSILSLEEKDTIRSQKIDQDVVRSLFDIIIRKGEESCNQFVECLKIRDQNLYYDLIGENVMGSVNGQDFILLADDLRKLYGSPVFQKFHPLGEETDIDILFDLKTTFTDPLLWKKSTQNRREKQLTLVELLHEFTESPCVIEGEAGKGKTTILKRIAVLWASGKCPALAHYKLVFFISLSSASGGLYETLCDQLIGVDYKLSKKAFMEELWKLRDRVLFLLDGYDEFHSQSCPDIDQLIKRNHMYKSMVILSTRTEKISKVRKHGSLIVETSDFTENNSEELIRNILDADQANNLLSHLRESNSMKNLMRTPLFVIISCALRMGESNLEMNTESALFCTLYDLMVEKSKPKLTDKNSALIAKSIIHCGNLALDGLFGHKFKFYQEDLCNINEDILLSIGLLNKYTAQTIKPFYRFFHTSFQEYTAGRRLSQLLSSESDSDVIRGEYYLSKIKSILEITGKYNNLLRYTSGSSKTATCKVIEHISQIHKEDIDNYGQEFVEFGVNLFYESSTKSSLSKEFEALFSDKSLYLNIHNISSHHIEFFQHLPNCLSALRLIKLDLFGDCCEPSSQQMLDTNSTPVQSKVSNSYIPEKTIMLFFDHRQALQTLALTLKDFSKLNRQDVKHLGKICCSSKRLSLHIERSAGITGTLTSVLETCKNMQDLIVDSTPLSIDDEKRIVEMSMMKTLSLINMQTEHQPGGLLYGLFKLQNIEELVLKNIKMNEDDAKPLASGLCNLSKLKILKLSDLTDVGRGMDFIAESISHTCHELEDLRLINCCLTKKALTIISQSMNSFSKLKILDLSDNYLEEGGAKSMAELVLALTPEITTLLLPGGHDVKLCLDELLNKLIQMPGLSNFGLKRWHLMNDDMAKLATFLKGNLENLFFLDLSENCATSDGWLSLTESLQSLKNLTHFNFSTEMDFIPHADLVMKLSKVISNLNNLFRIELNNWELDKFDQESINKAKRNLMTHR